MDNLVRLAIGIRQPLAEVITWEPEAVGSALRVLAEQAAAMARK